MSFPLKVSPAFLANAPLWDVERLWLEGACAYEVYDNPLMEDDDWDALGRHLRDRAPVLSAYFCHAVMGEWPCPEVEEGENPFKTASGINWHNQLSIANAVREGQANPRELQQRVSRWQARIRDIERGDLHLPRACRP